MNIVAVNWMETLFGPGRPTRLRRMIDEMHPAIRVVAGSPGLAEAMGRIESVPASVLFDRNGKVTLREGGQAGAIGAHPLSRAQLENALAAMN